MTTDKFTAQESTNEKPRNANGDEVRSERRLNAEVNQCRLDADNNIYSQSVRSRTAARACDKGTIERVSACDKKRHRLNTARQDTYNRV